MSIETFCMVAPYFKAGLENNELCLWAVLYPLVDSPEQWPWSSYPFYLFDEAGPVPVNVGWNEISFRDRVA